MLRMALLPLMVLQGRFEDVMYTLPSLFSKTCKTTSSLLKTGFEMRYQYMDFPGATQLDLEDVITIDLQLSEHSLIYFQVLLPSIHKIPAEGFVLYYLQLLQGTWKPEAVDKVLTLAEEARTILVVQLVPSIIA